MNNWEKQAHLQRLLHLLAWHTHRQTLISTYMLYCHSILLICHLITTCWPLLAENWHPGTHRTHTITHTVIISWNNTNRCMYCCEQTVCASAANRVGWWIVAKSPLPWASSISPLPNKNPNLSVPPISVLIFTLIIFLFSLCIFFPWAESRPLFFFFSNPLCTLPLCDFSVFSLSWAHQALMFTLFEHKLGLKLFLLR